MHFNSSSVRPSVLSPARPLDMLDRPSVRPSVEAYTMLHVKTVDVYAVLLRSAEMQIISYVKNIEFYTTVLQVRPFIASVRHPVRSSVRPCIRSVADMQDRYCVDCYNICFIQSCCTCCDG